MKKIECKLLDYYGYYFSESYNEFKSMLIYDVAQFIYGELYKYIQSQQPPEEKERVFRMHLDCKLNHARRTRVNEYIELLEHLKMMCYNVNARKRL